MLCPKCSNQFEGNCCPKCGTRSNCCGNRSCSGCLTVFLIAAGILLLICLLGSPLFL